MSEKLCLQWNDFRENVNCAFKSLREDADFADVTLACEDGKQVKAHKVILAASSPFFQTLLRKNNHPHPLIYMRGTKSEDLVAIVDFLYYGEANVFQENLDSFLAIAEELQLKGLMGQGGGDSSEEKEKMLPRRTEPTFKRESNKDQTVNENYQISQNEHGKANQSVALTSLFSGGGEVQDLDEKVKFMMDKTLKDGKKVFICKVCGKEGEHHKNMKRHFESNHLEGVLIPCNLCGKTARSRHALTMHMRKYHIDYQTL